MSLSARDRKILTLIVPLVLIAAYWFLVMSPKREEASTASAALTEQQERLESARAAAGSAEKAEQGFEANYATVVRLGKAIPSTVDMPSLLVQLDAAAAGTGIRFNTIAAGARTAVAVPEADAPAAEGTPAAAGGEAAQSDPGAAAEAANNAQQTADAQGGAAEQTAPDTQTSTSASGGGLPVGGGAAPAGDPAAAAGDPAAAAGDPAASAGDPAAAASPPAGLETVPIDLEFEGNFFNLADFFHRIKRFVRVANQGVVVSGRLLTIESVNWASDAEIFPRIRAEVTATVYLSPLAQGVTAGATPQGPATSTTPAAAQPAPAEAAPAATAAPTATATP
jgi:Tfp pilus assembly protein PilO